MYYGFRHFHPFEGNPPNDKHWFAGDVIFRARTVLKRRNFKQIKSAIGVVNWLIENSPIKALTWEKLEREALEVDAKAAHSLSNSQPVELDLHSDVNALRFCIDQYDLTEYSDLPDLQWSELFAVLALGMMDRAKADEEYYGRNIAEDGPIVDFDIYVSPHITFWLVQSMDAVSLAESLTKYESVKKDISAQVARQISLKNRKAGIQRHAKTAEAVSALLDFHRNGTFRSNAECVRKFIDQYPELVGHLTQERRHQTLASHLSKTIKSTSN